MKEQILFSLYASGNTNYRLSLMRSVAIRLHRNHQGILVEFSSTIREMKDEGLITESGRGDNTSISLTENGIKLVEKILS